MSHCCPSHTRREFLTALATLAALSAADLAALGWPESASAAVETFKVGGLPVT